MHSVPCMLVVVIMAAFSKLFLSVSCLCFHASSDWETRNMICPCYIEQFHLFFLLVTLLSPVFLVPLIWNNKNQSFCFRVFTTSLTSFSSSFLHINSYMLVVNLFVLESKTGQLILCVCDRRQFFKIVSGSDCI